MCSKLHDVNRTRRGYRGESTGSLTDSGYVLLIDGGTDLGLSKRPFCCLSSRRLSALPMGEQ